MLWLFCIWTWIKLRKPFILCTLCITKHSSSHYSSCTIGKHSTSKPSHKFSARFICVQGWKTSKTKQTRCFKSDEIEWKIKFHSLRLCVVVAKKVSPRWKTENVFMKNSRELILRFIKLHSLLAPWTQLPHQHVNLLIQLWDFISNFTPPQKKSRNKSSSRYDSVYSTR